MRDIAFSLLMAYGLIRALRQPWIGALMWVWFGLMSPHRFTHGFAFSLPWGAVVAAVTVLGLTITRDRVFPFRFAPPILLVIFMVWVTISWLNGFNVDAEFSMWSRAAKTFFMLLVVMSLLYTRRHILALVWVMVLSLATLGAKGGLFTVLTGGSYRVWGPEDSWVTDNNAFAVAIIMVIPLMRFLQLQLKVAWQTRLMGLAMVLCAISALGSQSRGALLSITAMALLLWWRGRGRFVGGILLVALAGALIAFMPDSWTERMETIQSYQKDGSAMNRIAAWKVALGLASDYVTGAGFSTGLSEYFRRYADYSSIGIVAHSIFFEVLGQHGYIGLAIFLAIGFTTWHSASRIRKAAANEPRAQWCVTLASMCQVSLLGYAVGGAFLTLAFYDLPYYLMAVVVMTRAWVEQRAWEREELPASSARALAVAQRKALPVGPRGA